MAGQKKKAVKKETPEPAPKPATKKIKKDPGITALLSFLWCGAGHIYLGELKIGIALAVIYAIALGIGLATLICFPLPLALWIYGIYDSYERAKHGKYKG